MKRSIYFLLAVGCASAVFTACGDKSYDPVDKVEHFRQAQWPIINGERVTGTDYYSTVSLYISNGVARESFCTGTLIAPNYVLTAGHCISDCEDEDPIEPYRPYMGVGFGQNQNSYTATYAIEKFIPHPNFICKATDIQNDIALLKLKTNVPSSVAVPTPPLPASKALTPKDIDNASITVTHVGFGLTNPNNNNTSGTKYVVDDDIVAICPLSGSQSYYCSEANLPRGFAYSHYSSRSVSTCQGDSGGPAFITRSGIQYVFGITSWGEEGCKGWSANTNVADYYTSFIIPNTGNIFKDEICDNQIDDNGDGLIDCQDPLCKIACTPEICDNQIDDNGDGLIDCQDPQCQNVLHCQPEICDNQIDDNGDGLIDCQDPQCQNVLHCQPEICDNQIDDNGDGLIDCQDPQCKDALRCQPEICDNQIDDNGNGLIDCQDKDCFDLPICQPEICDNQIDDNGDGLIDCQDPKCATSLACQPEDCSNQIDDNGDGLIDCQDPLCQNKPACIPEICDNAIDDNGDGLIDCQDPQCKDAAHCKKTENCTNQIDDTGNGLVDCQDPECASTPYCKSEICDDGVDNNNDGLVDCQDPQCQNASVCRVKDANSCAATPLRISNSPLYAGLFAVLAFLGFGIHRRKIKKAAYLP